MQLLKISKKNLRVSDSLFGTKKKYSFYLEESYFIRQDNRVYSLKKLNRKEIIPFLYFNKDLENWVDKSKINFYKEKDVLAVLQYLNTKRI